MTVVNDVMKYTDNIIIVNDGSTDETEKMLQSFPGIKKISYAKNKGKGWALRKGFEAAIDQGIQLCNYH